MAARLTLACLEKQTGPRSSYCLYRSYCHSSYTSNSKFFPLHVLQSHLWIVLLYLSHILFIIISIILKNTYLMMYYKDHAEALTPITTWIWVAISYFENACIYVACYLIVIHYWWLIAIQKERHERNKFWRHFQCLSKHSKSFWHRWSCYSVVKFEILWISGIKLHDYLSDQQQRVLFCGNLSDSGAVLIGVPQGSILDPLLLLC